MGSLGPCSTLSYHGCNFTFLCVIVDCLSLLPEVAFTVVCLGSEGGGQHRGYTLQVLAV